PPGGPAEFRHNRSQSAALHPLLRKHVKPKKQHEIRRLGKGHLSRVLAFGLGLPVSAVEADGRLVQAAERFDRELLRALRKAHARGDEVRTRRRRRHRHPATAPPWASCGARLSPGARPGARPRSRPPTCPRGPPGTPG
uniref:Ribosomal RNA adenine dimethylase domain containing 1 n=1 Tax=Nothoprocta perdicaria TaxID=30464 RepID=A0A8C6YTG6_NOTPE